MNRLPLLVFAFVLATSCSQPDKRKELLAATALLLHEGFDAGPASLRYNPIDCDCPPFEVRAGERWVRVALPESEDPESASAALAGKAKEDRESDDLITYRVPLELDSSSARFCANGTPYFDVELVEE